MNFVSFPSPFFYHALSSRHLYYGSCVIVKVHSRCFIAAKIVACYLLVPVNGVIRIDGLGQKVSDDIDCSVCRSGNHSLYNAILLKLHEEPKVYMARQSSISVENHIYNSTLFYDVCQNSSRNFSKKRRISK